MPISKAVAASGALPGIYEPVEIAGREFIDGGILSTTNVDVAIERGAKFIVVINPLVPYVNDFQKNIPTVTGSRVRRVSDMGIGAIVNQAFRLLSHDRLHRAVEIWEERYPGVDIILIEPELDDELMFGTSILDYRARLQIAKHGFESVTLKLARDYDRYKAIAERHGIEISARRVRHVLEQVDREREKMSAWRRVLELTNSALLRNSPQPRRRGRRAGRRGRSRRSSGRSAPASGRLQLAAVDQLGERRGSRAALCPQQPRPDLLLERRRSCRARRLRADSGTRRAATLRVPAPRTRAMKSLRGSRHERPFSRIESRQLQLQRRLRRQLSPAQLRSVASRDASAASTAS